MTPRHEQAKNKESVKKTPSLIMFYEFLFERAD